MNWITLSFLLYALMAWSLVGWTIVAWLSRPEPGPEDSDDDDGGIPPLDDPSGLDWGTWDEVEDYNSSHVACYAMMIHDEIETRELEEAR